MPPKKKPKPFVGTWYAVRCTTTRNWLFVTRDGGLAWCNHFVECELWRERVMAGGEAINAGVRGKYEIVPVRCRPLSARTKASKKRTR